MNRILRIYDRVLAMTWIMLPVALFKPTINTGGDQVVIALTSYPARISKIYRTIRSLLMQSLHFTKIVLVLSREEFPRGTEDLPRKLKRLIVKNKPRFDVVFTENNIKSYKKLLPVLSLYPAATLITADDDVIYWRSFAKRLYDAHRNNRSVIVGTRGTLIQTKENALEPYSSWLQSPRNIVSTGIFLTGRGGILYPPQSLDNRVSDWESARVLCPNADDIWFKTMAILAGTASMVVATRREYPASGASQRHALWRENVDLGENDAALLKTFGYFKISPNQISI